MKKADGIIIAAVLIAAAVFLIAAWGRRDGCTAVLYADNVELGRYPLTEDRTIPVELEEGYNTVVIKEGMASVTEADCANQVCVHTSAISRTGETVVCLPHKFYIVIK